MASATILWFRLDLRLHDHPALRAAIDRGGPIFPLFIWSPEEEHPWPPGAASRWWLHHSLARLDESLRSRGSRLILRTGPTLSALRTLISETGADALFWSRRYEPAVIARDTALKKTLSSDGLVIESFNASLLREPWTIQTGAGKPYQVFTPYWRACLAAPALPQPLPAPRQIPGPSSAKWPRSDSLDSLTLLPLLGWAGEFPAHFTPGETAALRALNTFIADAADAYTAARDIPSQPGTSRLSPHLHFGEISPRLIWQRILTDTRAASDPRPPEGSDLGPHVFLKELVWREFAYHLLYHFPHTSDEPLRPEFARFPWRTDPEALSAWQRGLTGYPIVDAGMRELWRTGWMHNRVRMLTASFLVKHLLIPWQEGAKWFWDTLVDADLASNTLGWQWTAGCGADAAPYFRIFNPTLQGEKFDPDGAYVRRYIPELLPASPLSVPTKYIHQPSAAPAVILNAAGIKLGETYPHPIVEHSFARQRALNAFASLQKNARS